jgi:hypothetical protein
MCLVASKGAFIKIVVNSYSCRWSIKIYINGDTIIPQDFQRGGPKNEQPKVVKFGYPIMPTRRENSQS